MQGELDLTLFYKIEGCWGMSWVPGDILKTEILNDLNDRDLNDRKTTLNIYLFFWWNCFLVLTIASVALSWVSISTQFYPVSDFFCQGKAWCARLHNKEIKLYYERRTLIDKKPRHYVLNAIANKLLRIIFTLVEKGEYYDANFIRQDPRVVKHN